MQAPLKIKIELQDMPFPVYRKLLLPAEIDMRQMHFVIQEVMGWHNAHLFEFKDNRGRATITVSSPENVDDEDFNLFGEKEVAAHEISLVKFFEFTGQKPIWYEYDFGDSWMHKITLYKTSKKDIEQFAGVPLCTEAKGAPPIEDIGGSWGYTDFLEVLKNPKSSEDRELIEWSGIDPDTFRPEIADQQELTANLVGLYESDIWNNDDYYGGFF